MTDGGRPEHLIESSRQMGRVGKVRGVRRRRNRPFAADRKDGANQLAPQSSRRAES
jgi:hypothetical protein